MKTETLIQSPPWRSRLSLYKPLTHPKISQIRASEPVGRGGLPGGNRPILTPSARGHIFQIVKSRRGRTSPSLNLGLFLCVKSVILFGRSGRETVRSRGVAFCTLTPLRLFSSKTKGEYREKIEFLEGEIERIKSPFKNRFKKSAAVKEPVSKTGNLIHFPAVKKENPCQ